MINLNQTFNLFKLNISRSDICKNWSTSFLQKLGFQSYYCSKDTRNPYRLHLPEKPIAFGVFGTN